MILKLENKSDDIIQLNGIYFKKGIYEFELKTGEKEKFESFLKNSYVAKQIKLGLLKINFIKEGKE